MRALGGAITSPCSNDSECRRPTLAILGLYPFLLLCCWFVVELCKNHPKGTLWETASSILCSQMTCTVVISIQKTLASIVIQLVLTEGRPPGQRPSLSHAAIRQKKGRGRRGEKISSDNIGVSGDKRETKFRVQGTEKLWILIRSAQKCGRIRAAYATNQWKRLK